ncbi:flagellar hook protein FlgE [Stutzerimonas urumqiensis]|uniref:flagellar hook protein FlgE n=1 Tax=Stutzerimonas urumqiensis TaxID=638269 RepID=UPI000EAF1AD5|nr:flagellar hook protein FlgE [Stutzerimonas urumqiensis]
MSFNIGLSGIRAANSDLNVTGNNIANAGTVGFKQSRAEFQDIYAASVLGTGSNPQGSGVLLGAVSQLHNQGTIDYTENALDMAINGNGFFVTSNNGAISYTRAGYFGTDKDGFVVDNNGYRLQGYSVDENGQLQAGVMSDLRIESASQAPQATSKITQPFNLNSTLKLSATWEEAYKTSRDGGGDVDAAEAAAAAAVRDAFDPTDPTTYHSGTSLDVYDSQGNPHVLSQYFVKTGDNKWDMHILVDGRNPTDTPAGSTASAVYELEFDGAGQLFSSAQGVPTDGLGIISMDWAPVNGADNGSFEFDLRGSTQFASTFSVTSRAQDGYTTGQLSGLEIDDTGNVFARYTNGQSRVQGQVVLANFANTQGLTPIGKTSWVQSSDSGEPVIGTPRSGTLGALQAGALEASNVDLSTQLVNLIVAQRNYQANAKTIETENAVTQTIINLR